MVRLDRRVFLAMVLFLAPAARLRARQPRPSAISLDQFLELSARLLQRPKPDPQLAQLYLDALSADPDSAVHLATLYQMNGNPTPEQAALAGTIIEWWYTGVYTVDGKPRLATHSGALMWDALGMPAPGTCAAPFGAWSSAPPGIA
jgi:hypothetical protein